MLAAWIIAGCAALGQAAPGGEANLSSTVRLLVEQLDAAEKSRRDEAEEKLLKLGPAALQLLPPRDDRLPAEVNLRVARVRLQLERSQADASVEASTVTLSGKLPLADVIAAISKQTGNKLVDFRPQFGEEVRNVDVTVNFNNTPFWQVLDQVFDQANLTIYNFAGEEGISFVGRSPSMLPRFRRASYAGAFRIEGTDFTAHRDLRDPASHTLQLNLEAAWEPRLKPIIIAQPANSIVATDENGKPLPLAGSGEELEINVNPGAYSVEIPIHFALPDRSVKRVAKLKGKLAAVLPGRSEDFRFTNLEKAKKVEQRQAGVTVVLEEVWKNNAVWEVRVRVVFDKAGNALESHRNWIFNNEAWLEAPDKEKLAFAGMETTRQGENEVGVSYLFGVPEGLAGYTFVYRTPVSINPVPVEFELKDIDLP